LKKSTAASCPRSSFLLFVFSASDAPISTRAFPLTAFRPTRNGIRPFAAGFATLSTIHFCVVYAIITSQVLWISRGIHSRRLQEAVAREIPCTVSSKIRVPNSCLRFGKCLQKSAILGHSLQCLTARTGRPEHVVRPAGKQHGHLANLPMMTASCAPNGSAENRFTFLPAHDGSALRN
jgi:hypothetical protein